MCLDFRVIAGSGLAMGLTDLDHRRSCDDALVNKIPIHEDPARFINSARLRTLGEIQTQADLLYRIHWFCVHSRLKKKDSPFNEELIFERRRAVDWVYGVAKDWDQMPMDT